MMGAKLGNPQSLTAVLVPVCCIVGMYLSGCFYVLGEAGSVKDKDRDDIEQKCLEGSRLS